MSFAVRTGLGNAEYAAGHHDLAPAAAGGARFGRRPFFRACPAAGVAAVEFVHGNFLITTPGCFFQGDFQIVPEIIAAFGSGAVAAAAKDTFENAAAAAAKDFPENVKGIVEPASGAAAKATGRSLARVKRRMAILVVGGAFLRVA